jgi:hypothetical protein
MRNRLYRLGIALSATCLFALATSTASAGTLSTSTDGFLAQWRSLEVVSSLGVVIRCPVTLDGSFHSRTIAKVARSLIGYITLAVIHQTACSNGRGAALNGTETYNGTTTPNTLPWHATYESFSGSLPAIQSARLLINRFRFGITVPGICTGQYGATTDNISGDFSRELVTGVINTLTPTAGRNIESRIRTDGGICPATGTMENTANVSQLTSNNRVTLSLI